MLRILPCGIIPVKGRVVRGSVPFQVVQLKADGGLALRFRGPERVGGGHIT